MNKADTALSKGQPVYYRGRAGVPIGFRKRRTGANEHTIRFEDGGIEVLKLKEISWSTTPPGNDHVLHFDDTDTRETIKLREVEWTATKEVDLCTLSFSLHKSCLAM